MGVWLRTKEDTEGCSKRTVHTVMRYKGSMKIYLGGKGPGSHI